MTYFLKMLLSTRKILEKNKGQKGEKIKLRKTTYQPDNACFQFIHVGVRHA